MTKTVAIHLKRFSGFCTLLVVMALVIAPSGSVAGVLASNDRPWHGGTASTGEAGVARTDSDVPSSPEDSLVADGPYVWVTPTGWLARSVGPDGDVRDSGVTDGRVAVPGGGGVAGFEVILRATPQSASSVEDLPTQTPVVILADTHGEYAILVALLKAQGLIDERLRWRFGTGHLVVAGDMLDRGAHQIEILWLLYQLEAEARAQGGRVHVLLGNHEALVLRDDARYLNPRYGNVAQRLGAARYSGLLGADTVPGAWLRSRPAMLKLGDLLIVHGGVSPAITASDLDMDTINGIVRRSLDIPYAIKPVDGSPEALVLGAEGPLWYRGYFPMQDRPPTATQAEVAASLARFGVSTILVGHTVVDRVSPLYSGQVIAVQVYPHLDGEGRPVLEAAMRRDGRWHRLSADGSSTALEDTPPVAQGQ